MAASTQGQAETEALAVKAADQALLTRSMPCSWPLGSPDLVFASLHYLAPRAQGPTRNKDTVMAGQQEQQASGLKQNRDTAGT